MPADSTAAEYDMTTTRQKKTAPQPKSERFEFGELIGSGGLGSVFRGLDRSTGQAVAIKVLKLKLSENRTAHERLAREFRAAHTLDHPNIVRAIAHEVDGETSFVVYELVEGRSVGDRIDAEGRIAEPEAVRIITQVAQALHFAHQRQVIHRDVKPDNILLLPDGRAKLTDFGLVKDYEADDPDLTRQASGLGTPHYMAPEQFVNARAADARCDVYSLGATLFNMVTGVMPFDARIPLAILAKKELGQLSARAHVPELSERIEVAIRTAIDPDPDKRPQTTLKFFELLTRRRRSPADLTLTPAPVKLLEKPATNRRAWARHPFRVGACGRLDVSIHSDNTEPEIWPMIIQDLSAGGMGVLLVRRFEVGTILSVELCKGLDGNPISVQLRVVRVARDQAGQWLHGCKLLKPLPGSVLNFLLNQA